MDTPTVPYVRVRMLGSFALTGGEGGDLTLPRRKLRALVALLAFAPARGWSREQLTALLWGDRDEEQARGSLRQALAELRRILGDSVLRADREMVGFESTAVNIDAVEFARLAAAGDLEQASSLYRGDLLEGVSLPDAGFSDWLLVERTRLRDLAISVLARLLAAKTGDDAIATAQRLLQLDPAREETHRALMRLYAAQGNRCQALRQYQLCRDVLQHELGVKVEAETERLFKEIQSSSRSAACVPTRPAERREIAADTNAQATPRGSPDPPRVRSWRRPAMIAAAFVVLTVAGLAMLWDSGKPSIEPATIERMALPLPDKPSIAVLPFANMSDDPKQEYFADGLTDGLITELSQVSGLFVIARNSIFTYKGRTVPPKQVSEELGIRYVLEGSVQRSGDRLRINAQLVDALSAGHVWAGKFDGSVADVFALQDRVARSIADTLAVKLTEAEHVALGRVETSVPAAYESFLRGWAHYRRATPEDFAKAVPYFEETVRLDPHYARAHAALAMVHFLAYDEGWSGLLGIPADDAFRISRDYLKRASAHPTSTSHQVAGNISRSRGWHDDALREFQAAIALDPNDSWTYAYLAFALIHARRPAEAPTQIEIAMRLDPHYPPLFDFYQGLAQFEQNRMAEAAIIFDNAGRRGPGDPRPLLYLAATYGHLGREKEAAEIVATYSSARVRQGGLPFVMAELTSKRPSYRPPPGSPLVRGLLRAGVPYNFDSSAFNDLLLSQTEVESLLFGHRLHGRVLRTGWEHGVSVSPDGTAVMFGGWGSGAATAKLVGAGVCLVRTTTTNCGRILRNPGGSKATENEYIWFASPAAYPFSQLE
jgi:TolB-like protein/DNA-binding SARP family transcriptional activator/Tfp pilus assembly protein PilF